MFEFQRQHPVAAISSAFNLIRGNFITILIFLFVGARSEDFPFLWWTAAGFVFLLVMGSATWWRFLYRVEDGELHIKRGIFVRKNLYLTRDRIQVIDITAGVVQRLFGLVRVDIQTAGSTSREAAIEAVTLERAKEISELLRPAGNGTKKEEAGPESFAIPEEKTYKLPGKELAIAASTSGSFGIALSVLATLFSQIEPVISDSALFEYAMDLLPSQTDWFAVVTIILTFIVFAWLLSFFSTLFTYGDFSLKVTEDELVISRGIFEKKRITVPFNRIQAVYAAEGLIRQPLGYASLHLESAGYGDEKGTGSIVLLPLIRRGQISNFLESALPDYLKQLQGVKPPPRALRRYILRAAFAITILTAAAWWLLDLNEWIWLMPVLSLFWGWLKFKDAAVGWIDEGLLLRSRSLSKSTAYIRKNRIQDVTIMSTWFQRIRDLCSVRVYVASGDQGKSFVVKDLDKSDGERLLRAIKEPGVENVVSADTGSKTVTLPGWPQAAN